jgi:hypothetical protein
MHPLTRPSFVAVLLLAAAPLVAQTPGNPSGHWEGSIQIPDRELKLTIDLAKSESGAWAGSMTIPNTTTTDVPLSEITVENGAVRFAASLPGRTSFEGSLSTDANGLSGTVSNAEGGVPFQLRRSGAANVKAAAPSSPLTKAFEGTWQGAVESAGTVRRIVLKLAPAADGTAIGTLISVDKGTDEIPVTTVTIRDAQLRLEVRMISGTYRGTLGEGGEIAGEWMEGGARLTLNFRRTP